MRVVINTKDSTEKFIGVFKPLLEEELLSLNPWIFKHTWVDYFFDEKITLLKLLLEGDGKSIPQALVAFHYDSQEGFMYIKLIEKNPLITQENNLSITPPVLAYIAHLALTQGEGVMALDAKTQLIGYYESFGGIRFRKTQKVFYHPFASEELVQLYCIKGD